MALADVVRAYQQEALDVVLPHLRLEELCALGAAFAANGARAVPEAACLVLLTLYLQLLTLLALCWQCSQATSLAEHMVILDYS